MSVPSKSALFKAIWVILDTALSYVRKLKLLIHCLAVPRCPIHQWPWKKYLCSKVPPENDFGGSIIMIYKLERALVLTKQMFNYYNTKFLLEITSKVEKVVKQHTITHKLITNCYFQTRPCVLQKCIRLKYLSQQDDCVHKFSLLICCLAVRQWLCRPCLHTKAPHKMLLRQRNGLMIYYTTKQNERWR